MTPFDALMPSAAGASGNGAGGARPSGESADWRQAVEQAQARSWLRDRTPMVGQGRPQPGRGESAPLEKPTTDRGVQTGVPSADLSDKALDAVIGPGADLAPTGPARQAAGVGPAAHAGLPLPVVQRLASAPANPPGNAALPAAAAVQGEALRGTRARKQSIHVESGEQGVSVWIRDASLNSREASHLAAAIAASLSSGRQDVASLYLNGHPVADGTQLSSPKSSE